MSNIADWGMGVIINDTGEVTSYGYPEDLNPNHFYPDAEICSREERNNHKKALLEWEEKNEKGTNSKVD